MPVDEFTEKDLEIPVKLINNRNYENVKIFPQKVKVTFTTSLSRYAEIDEDFFEATADLGPLAPPWLQSIADRGIQSARIIVR